jgi:methylated-DNA-[protein]-cysteine S-methyltransferase
MRFHPDTVAARHASPLGPVLLAATPQGLAGLWFEAQRHHPDASRWPLDPSHPLLREAMVQLDDYFLGRRTRFDLPLDLQGGTPFQQTVWRALLAVPCGARTSYGALSREIGRPAAVRAVGAAVGRNPVSIVVPCHRVLGSDGSLTGYAGGLDRKTALLQLEGAA